MNEIKIKEKMGESLTTKKTLSSSTFTPNLFPAVRFSRCEILHRLERHVRIETQLRAD